MPNLLRKPSGLIFTIAQQLVPEGLLCIMIPPPTHTLYWIFLVWRYIFVVRGGWYTENKQRDWGWERERDLQEDPDRWFLKMNLSLVARNIPSGVLQSLSCVPYPPFHALLARSFHSLWFKCEHWKDTHSIFKISKQYVNSLGRRQLFKMLDESGRVCICVWMWACRGEAVACIAVCGSNPWHC